MINKPQKERFEHFSEHRCGAGIRTRKGQVWKILRNCYFIFIILTIHHHCKLIETYSNRLKWFYKIINQLVPLKAAILHAMLQAMMTCRVCKITTRKFIQFNNPISKKINKKKYLILVRVFEINKFNIYPYSHHRIFINWLIHAAKYSRTDFSLAWASDGALDPFPLAYMTPDLREMLATE